MLRQALLNYDADVIDRIAAVAARVGREARIAVRINPDVAAGTHRHIATGSSTTKFGVSVEEARAENAFGLAAKGSKDAYDDNASGVGTLGHGAGTSASAGRAATGGSFGPRKSASEEPMPPPPAAATPVPKVNAAAPFRDRAAEPEASADAEAWRRSPPPVLRPDSPIAPTNPKKRELRRDPSLPLDPMGYLREVRAGGVEPGLSLIHISEPTRPYSLSYSVFCLHKTNLVNDV